MAVDEEDGVGAVNVVTETLYKEAKVGIGALPIFYYWSLGRGGGIRGQRQ